MKKILIATPIFPPTIGGPAIHAENLAREFQSKGHKVSVLTYGWKGKIVDQLSFRLWVVSSGWLPGLKHLVYFTKAFFLLARSDVALVFDPFIVGAPVAVANSFFGRPMIVRVEGDFLWEMFSARTRSELPLKDFWARFPKLELNGKEKFIYNLTRWVFNRADFLVFSSRWRESIFEQGYLTDASKRVVVSSPWPRGGRGEPQRERVILFAGRLVWIKNIPRLIRSFLVATGGEWRLEIIGAGPEKATIEKVIEDMRAGQRVYIHVPLSRDKLLERIAEVHALALPSFSDVSPNVIMDCISAGTPFLMTKESGFYEVLKEIGIFVDPLYEESIREGLATIIYPEVHADYRRRIASFTDGRSWSDTADAWLKIISDFKP